MRFSRPFAILFAALALGAAPGALAQELPPGPTTVQPLSRLPLETTPGPFQETLVVILEFAPGAQTPLHSHGGVTLVRVLEGELTRHAGGTSDVFRAGEGWVETPRDVHSAGNTGSAPSRVLVTFLLPSGAPPTTVEGAPGQVAPPGPSTIFQSKRVPVQTSATGFEEAATTVLGFAPGAWTPRHSHGGLTLVAVTDGEMTVRGSSGETIYRPGDVWIEQPGDVHLAGNAAAGEARVAVTFLLRQGDPVTTVAAAQAPVQVPGALPRTGNGNAPLALTAALGAALLGGGMYLRRRHSGS